MIFGVDSHKPTLSICAIDPSAGSRRRASSPTTPPATGRSSPGSTTKHRDARPFGIEGSGSFGYGLTRALVAAGETVPAVPPSLADGERRRGRRGKSDALDALAIARVAAREELSVIRDDPLARDLTLACDYRAQLEGERTRIANRLHADLVQLAPGYQTRCPNLSGPRMVTRAARILSPHHGLQGDSPAAASPPGGASTARSRSWSRASGPS